LPPRLSTYLRAPACRVRRALRRAGGVAGVGVVGRGAPARPGAAADVAPALAAAGLTRAPTGTAARGGTAPSRTTPRVCSRTVPPPVPSGGASGVRRAVPWRLRTG